MKLKVTLFELLVTMLILTFPLFTFDLSTVFLMVECRFATMWRWRGRTHPDVRIVLGWKVQKTSLCFFRYWQNIFFSVLQEAEPIRMSGLSLGKVQKNDSCFFGLSVGKQICAFLGGWSSAKNASFSFKFWLLDHFIASSGFLICVPRRPWKKMNIKLIKMELKSNNNPIPRIFLDFFQIFLGFLPEFLGFLSENFQISWRTQSQKSGPKSPKTCSLWYVVILLPTAKPLKNATLKQLIYNLYGFMELVILQSAIFDCCKVTLLLATWYLVLATCYLLLAARLPCYLVRLQDVSVAQCRHDGTELHTWQE